MWSVVLFISLGTLIYFHNNPNAWWLEMFIWRYINLKIYVKVMHINRGVRGSIHVRTKSTLPISSLKLPMLTMSLPIFGLIWMFVEGRVAELVRWLACISCKCLAMSRVHYSSSQVIFFGDLICIRFSVPYCWNRNHHSNIGLLVYQPVFLPAIYLCSSLLICQFSNPVNSSPPGQNGRHFADDNFNCIFVNETV